MSRAITPEMVAALKQRSLTLDFPQIKLQQNVTHVPRVFEGSGLITQTNDGALLLRAYPRDIDAEGALTLQLEQSGKIEPGVLLPDDVFYTLEARDVFGRLWLNPKVQLDISGGPAGTVFKASIDALHLTEDRSQSDSHIVTLTFLEELKLPWNRATEETRSSGGTRLSQRHEYDRAEFDVGEVRFTIQRGSRIDGVTTVRAHSSQALVSGFEWRVQEAMRFVTFRSVTWGIAEISSGEQTTVTLLARQASDQGFFPPALSSTDSREDFWELFGSYLRYVCSHQDKDTFHPLSSRLLSLMDAGSRIETLSLLLGVAVEGVLKTEFSGVAPPPRAFVDAIEGAMRIARRLKCVDEVLRSRLVGSLSAMLDSRAKDKLKYLAELGVVTKAACNAWSKLRNTSAHAASVHSGSQEQITLCFQVYDLLLCLVFQAIGYSGKHTQFSQANWPIGSFRPASLE